MIWSLQPSYEILVYGSGGFLGGLITGSIMHGAMIIALTLAATRESPAGLLLTTLPSTHSIRVDDWLLTDSEDGSTAAAFLICASFA